MLTRITLGYSRKLLCYKAMTVEKVTLLLRIVLHELPQYPEVYPRRNSGKKSIVAVNSDLFR